MLRHMCKGKIHRAMVTAAEPGYEGSITIDRRLMEAADLLAHERVQVLNHNNGERLETYVIEGEPDSGVICLNGPAARLGQVGDLVTIIGYAHVADAEARSWQPTIVQVDAHNRVASKTISASAGERRP
jgi:aspartate 1-decarboxylase